ncbi:MAG: hypothetical protein KatS3mg109_1687 [Pirellulaceae bacterium]|nr:MAG: hypothetical protein KatS3mg109_1687 [Pirellulaceae bacterium]
MREAVQQVNREFGGEVVGEDSGLFLMHYHLPRLNEDGYVWFELSPDIHQPLGAEYGKPKGRKGGRK